MKNNIHNIWSLQCSRQRRILLLQWFDTRGVFWGISFSKLLKIRPLSCLTWAYTLSLSSIILTSHACFWSLCVLRVVLQQVFCSTVQRVSPSYLENWTQYTYQHSDMAVLFSPPGAGCSARAEGPLTFSFWDLLALHSSTMYYVINQFGQLF